MKHKHRENMTFDKLFDIIFDQSRRHRFPLGNRVIKLGEEFGELCEAVNHHEGLLPHKTMKEPLAGEVADVIITALDVMCEAYADLSHDEVMTMLAEQIGLKSQKWEVVLINLNK